MQHALRCIWGLQVEVSYTDKWISVSQYPLSAACCLGRITNALEAKWNII